MLDSSATAGRPESSKPGSSARHSSGQAPGPAVPNTKQHSQIVISSRSIILKLVDVMGTLQASLATLFLVSLAPAAELKITLLATTDLHGNLFPYDYYTAQPADRGLAKIATLIQAARASNPNNLLIDCGYTIQGAPREAVYQQYLQTGKAET